MKRIIICLLAIAHCSLVSAQSVGIGTTSPNSSAALDVSSTTKGMLLPRMTTAQRNAIVAPADGLLIYNTSTNELNQRQGGGWKIIINNDAWTGGGSGQLFNIGDNVGINTAGPQERLDVNGNIRSNSSMIINNPTAILQLQNAGTNKGFVQLSGDNLRLGTNGGNPDGNIVMRLDGNDIIEYRKSGTGGTVIQMNTNSSSAAVLQTTGAGNVSLTAVNANAQVQLGGEVFINNTANTTGIGTSSPTERLHVNGNMIVNGSAVIDGGRVTAAATGSAYNLLPLAYGRVSASGAKAGGTANFTSVNKISEGNYEVFVTGVTTSSVVILTTRFPLLSIGLYDVSAGKFAIRIYSLVQEEDQDNPFHFVVYNPE